MVGALSPNRTRKGGTTGSLCSLASSVFQAALCARQKGCCNDLLLGEADGFLTDFEKCLSVSAPELAGHADLPPCPGPCRLTEQFHDQNVSTVVN